MRRKVYASLGLLTKCSLVERNGGGASFSSQNGSWINATSQLGRVSYRLLPRLLTRHDLAWPGIVPRMVGQVLSYLVARDVHGMRILVVVTHLTLVLTSGSLPY
jgi:hypothetical protein